MTIVTKLWSDLNPKAKRIVAVAGMLGALMLVLSVVTKDPEKKVDKPRHETIKSVLTDRNTRDIGIDSVSGNLALLESTVSKVLRSVERVEEDVKKNAEKSKQEIEALKNNLNRVENDVQRTSYGRGNSAKADPANQSVTPQDLNAVNVNDPGASFTTAPMPNNYDENGFAVDSHQNEANRDARDANFKSSSKANAAPPSMKIYSYSAGKDEGNDKNNPDKTPNVFLNAGSILSGVLLNGLDAPTGQNARKDPFPVTMRIQKDALLPNLFTADVKECVLTLSGYGDLSAERAYLRTELLSCITESGQIIETSLDGYANGEDGKAGLRGRLVSKNGQLIAKSLMAGFFSGMSEAFDVNPVPVINTTGSFGNNQQYQDVYSPELLKSAGVKGASSGLDRIAQYYMNMAEQIYPVIEIDALRKVDVFLTRGVKLKPIKP